MQKNEDKARPQLVHGINMYMDVCAILTAQYLIIICRNVDYYKKCKIYLRLHNYKYLI